MRIEIIVLTLNQYKKLWYHRKDANIKISKITSIQNIQMLLDAKSFVLQYLYIELKPTTLRIHLSNHLS